MINKKIVLSAWLCAIFGGVLFTSQVKAFEDADLLKSYFQLHEQTGAHLTAIQLKTLSNLESRRAKIENHIATGLDNGYITPRQAYDFRAALSRNAYAQDIFLQDGYMGASEAEALANSLNVIDSHVVASVGSTIAAIPVKAVFWTPGYEITWDNVDLMKKDVITLLDQGRENGMITINEYNTLKNRYDVITTVTTVNLNAVSERNAMIYRLADLANSISREINDRQVAASMLKSWE